MNEKIIISSNDLLNKFQEQLFKIETLCKIYDDGNIGICEEIAVKLRVLFHNANRSKSLLKISKLEHVVFMDTASKFEPRNLFTSYGLIMLFQNHEHAEYRPVAHLNGYKLVSFENWWKNKKVICDKYKNTFTRKDIVRHVADTDGGAHVDDSIFKDYYELTRNNSLGWNYGNEYLEKSLGNPIPACIRQIAYEAIITFKNKDLKVLTKLYFKKKD